ncbi:hypothetical protein D9613_011269 [Agrocybe pediades]|uniref:DUF6534 domain-containing protein n=1 Tax=Agrocybe pediades TaxID=84607 RepID=A0A8H4VQ04_9AGAR|nr:hypothetical protein D9613_011269 [Agrocybe pediades]
MPIESISPSPFTFQSNRDLGALQVTTFISLVMFGVLLSQGYIYFSRNKDRPSLRSLVGFLLFMEACHSFTSSQAIYYNTVTRYPNSYALTTTAAIENITTALVQVIRPMYPIRHIMPHPNSDTVRRRHDSGGLQLHGRPEVREQYRPGGEVQLGDNIPSGVRRRRGCSDSSFDALLLEADGLAAQSDIAELGGTLNPPRRDMIIGRRRLSIASLETGLLTSMTSVTVIICFQALPNMIWFSFYVLLAKVYSNSLLASLNARSQMRRQVVVTPVMSALLTFEAARPISVSFRTTQGSGIASNVNARSVEFPSQKSEGDEESVDDQGL